MAKYNTITDSRLFRLRVFYLRIYRLHIIFLWRSSSLSSLLISSQVASIKATAKVVGNAFSVTSISGVVFLIEPNFNVGKILSFVKGDRIGWKQRLYLITKIKSTLSNLMSKICAKCWRWTRAEYKILNPKIAKSKSVVIGSFKKKSSDIISWKKPENIQSVRIETETRNINSIRKLFEAFGDRKKILNVGWNYI